MLIEFSVTNYRSIKTQQTLSLAMAKGGELADINGFTPTALSTLPLLRSAVLYGPNAAGKSNIIRAMAIMKQIVLASAKELQRGDSLPVTPFLLDSTTAQAPTEFEISFIAEGCRYQYGFSATQERVVEEWLLAYPHGRPQRWIGRAWCEEKQEYAWEKMSALSGAKQLWQESTRSNALFLSTAVQLNCNQLQPIYDWFRTKLRPTNVSRWNPRFTASLCKETEQRNKILAFLKAADIGIDDLQVEMKKLSAQHLPDGLPDELKTKLFESIKEKEVFDIKTTHLNEQNVQVKFDVEDESDGTQKLFAFAGPWLNTLENGYVVVVDELHDNLHPKLVEFLVQLFHSPVTNPHNAQLIFTTHETSILNQDIFRRDQVWFCEKDEAKATQLYPLTDFSPRKGRENLELAYLAGRYGALPYVRELAMGKRG